MTDLFCDQTSDTLSPPMPWRGEQWDKGEYTVTGTLDGATVGLSLSTDEGNLWMLLDGTQTSTPLQLFPRLPVNGLLRAWLENAGENTCVSVSVSQYRGI